MKDLFFFFIKFCYCFLYVLDVIKYNENLYGEYYMNVVQNVFI